MSPGTYALRRVRPARIGAAARVISLIAESDAFEDGMTSDTRVEFLRLAIENFGRVCHKTEEVVHGSKPEFQETSNASE